MIVMCIILILLVALLVSVFFESRIAGCITFFIGFFIMCGCLTIKTRVRQYTGYVVEKDYTPGHMCHSEPTISRLLVIVPTHPHVTPHHHKWIKQQWGLYVANRDGVHNIEIDSSVWAAFKPGDKVIVTKYDSLSYSIIRKIK